MVETASFEQLAALIQEEPRAFEVFRSELKKVVEDIGLAAPSARPEAARTAAAQLGREQVHEVSRKLAEARGKLGWEIR